VGPDAMTSSRSPITSEMISVTMRALVAWTSPPPFTRDRCFRTAFISSMVAPEASRRSVIRCFSVRLTSRTGAGHSAEPPPEMRQKSRSLGFKD